MGYDVDRGPYSSTGDYSDPSYDNPYTISICQSEIDAFSLWWECNNGLAVPGCSDAQQPSNDVLSSIYNWPGNGNTSLGQSQQLAPYFDRNGDGVYDPIGQGDYPIIKGCCATYMIQNDAGKLHTYSGTDPIGIEMHYLFYQYGANDLLYNTTFMDVMAINKGEVDYPNFSQGFYVDGDLGSYGDDYMGSDSLNNMMFFYNADNMDENGYGVDPPALGIVALETPLTSVVPYSSNNMNSVAGAAYQMNGLKYDSSPWIDPDGNTTTFAFSGNPNDTTQWSMMSAANAVPSDNRSLMNTTYNQFNAGDTVKQSYAIIYSRVGNHLENAEYLSTLAAEIQAFHDSGDTGCDAGGYLGFDELMHEEIRVYPNPNKGEFIIDGRDLSIKSLRIVDVAGKEIDYSKHSYGTEVKVDLTEKSAGVYLVFITTEYGQHTERIIIE